MSTLRSGRTSQEKSATIEYRGFELTVSGDYIEGDQGDEWTPSTASDLENTQIIYKGVDISDLVIEISDYKIYNDIINTAIEQIEQ